MTEETALHVRRSEAADLSAILSLLSASLGWLPDEHFEQFFAWKHEASPFGSSPGWVAADDDGTVIGFRTFMRWQYLSSGRRYRAVRAVDTATHPDHQGRGIFRRLTLGAIEEMAAEGVDFVFNTPNANSRPGYLKMGWTQLGRLPVAARATSVAALRRMVSSRVPAERWSAPSTAGRPALDVLESPGIEALVAALSPSSRLRTDRSPAFLRWRYGFAPLGYRAVTISSDPEEGIAVFRLRRRGAALECALCDLLVPAGNASARRKLLREVTKRCEADYVIRIGGEIAERPGFVRVPGQGPILTWRGLGAHAPGGELRDWDLALGDVELF